ncbi:AAA family ATPase [Microbacterium trichothecenolyticum]|uniref:ABC-type ATPase n=1 Tax=Microbacterium trichothecenolyticum TaxID=69370 RepID=A0ABU0TUW3_MICTR|nr:AAA family ATPase [Microbacterium trichothecenolyticum]MDQ1123434.1 putative ABC-type ATPase [Microbacterium trichothecenolyticum]
MPVLHLIAGPNGSGKTTFVTRVIGSVTHLPFINADVIAAERWPDAQMEHAREASQAAAEQRAHAIARGDSFISETVFSHESKLQLVQEARAHGYHVHLHVMMLPLEVTVRRVQERVAFDRGHDVPEQKVRARYERLWTYVSAARDIADRADFLDNSRAAAPFRLVARYQNGIPVGRVEWPEWTPDVLR